MPKQVVSDIFETMGGAAKATGQQAASDVKKMGEDFLESLGVKPSLGQKPPDPNIVQKDDEQMKNLNEADRSRSTARYQQIQEEIKALQKKRTQEIPKEIAGKPGFSEEKMIKQIETKQADKKKPEPLPVKQASKKAEMFRGASG